MFHTDCERVVSWAIDTPWAITPAMLGVVATALGRRLVDKAEAAAVGPVIQARTTVPAPTGGQHVVVLPMHGVLAPRVNLLSNMSGGVTLEGATAAIKAAVADPLVKTIILDWDSPGGSVAGATEFARVLLDARTRKEIISVANHQMCSAAYWTGACASRVVATPSAMVGSIGVYCIHENLARYLEQKGVTLSYIAAGKFKVDGNPSEPLMDSARARLKYQVDVSMATFVADVAAGRGVSPEVVSSRMGEGLALTAAEALDAGLIDGIDTLDTVIARAVAAAPVPRPSSLSAADLQLGYDLAALDLGYPLTTH